MIQITEKQNCTGCHACVDVCPVQCIDMVVDSEGFLYPSVNEETCIGCDLCNKTCPVYQDNTVKNEPSAFACINQKEITRLQSSSGGMFSLVAESVIENGGAVFGATFDGAFRVVHQGIETLEGLTRLRGSKYVQSEIGETYKHAKEFLEQGRQVLFSGTPCQISGLIAFLGREYDLLFCVDIICHGVPSPLVWQNYIKYREQICGSKVKEINFRQKVEGWKLFSMSFSFENHTEYQKSLMKDLFLQGFLKNVYLRPSCYDCKFKTIHRQSDITLADFWEIQSILPDMDDDKGTSLVLQNSEKGKKMLDQIKDRMIMREADLNQAILYNPAAIASARKNPKRELFFQEMNQISFDKLMKKYCTESVYLRGKKLFHSGLSNTKQMIRKTIHRGK